ncbi:MAG TPA: protein-disulfide reductase DsbD family protein [Lacibacter sp.]|nr:protein-disulfide reductase DsbD family protein [Lacibacter sp.]HMO88834.1 protein-disulfide reductase DsbD family protein [Lacibacter sp.]HMP85872.1 protein-disulfide reductase DsbD family protein [Lacibacter sp.]
MKQLFTTAVFLLAGLLATAQSGTKVKWNYSAKKLAANKYEVRLTATIDKGWHLYSQQQSEDAIALPTTISFAKNPLVTLVDKTKEVGKLYDQYDKATASRSRFYSDKVEFVQVVTTRGTVKTTVSGEVEFMVCDDKQCLPPDKVKFSVAL